MANLRAQGDWVDVAYKRIRTKGSAEPSSGIVADESIGIEGGARAGPAEADFQEPAEDAGGCASNDPIKDAGSYARI